MSFVLCLRKMSRAGDKFSETGSEYIYMKEGSTNYARVGGINDDGTE